MEKNSCDNCFLQMAMKEKILNESDSIFEATEKFEEWLKGCQNKKNNGVENDTN